MLDNFYLAFEQNFYIDCQEMIWTTLYDNLSFKFEALTSFFWVWKRQFSASAFSFSKRVKLKETADVTKIIALNSSIFWLRMIHVAWKFCLLRIFEKEFTTMQNLAQIGKTCIFRPGKNLVSASSWKLRTSERVVQIICWQSM